MTTQCLHLSRILLWRSTTSITAITAPSPKFHCLNYKNDFFVEAGKVHWAFSAKNEMKALKPLRIASPRRSKVGMQNWSVGIYFTEPGSGKSGQRNTLAVILSECVCLATLKNTLKAERRPDVFKKEDQWIFGNQRNKKPGCLLTYEFKKKNDLFCIKFAGNGYLMSPLLFLDTERPGNHPRWTSWNMAKFAVSVMPIKFPDFSFSNHWSKTAGKKEKS